MPELPEVEAARRALHDNCCGRVILTANIADDPKVIEGVTPVALRKALVGRKILGTCRKGKNLWLQLDERPWPTFQFGMTGAFHMKGKEITKYKRSAVSDKEEWPSKFSKVFFKLDDGLEVSFTDKRRFARVRLLDDPPMAPPVSELGPDAYLELPLESTFVSGISKKKCSIKALLLDQSFIAGIGNWIADEVLYQAKIHPERLASSISEKECIALHRCIQEVIKISVEVDADSERFPESWIFHHRWMKKPGEIGGNKINFITVGGRTSAYVPALQKCTSSSLEKKNDTADNQLGKQELENSKSMIKKRGTRGNRKDDEAEINLTVEAEESTIKQGRKKKASQIEKKPREQMESKGEEFKKVRKQKKIHREENIVEETKQIKVSLKQKTGSRLSKAKKPEIDSKEQATVAEQTKQGMPLGGNQAEQEDQRLPEAVMIVSNIVQNQEDESGIRKEETAKSEDSDDPSTKAKQRRKSGNVKSAEREHNDEVGKKSRPRKRSGNLKTGLQNELLKPASISHVSDTLKRPQGHKRKRGS